MGPKCAPSPQSTFFNSTLGILQEVQHTVYSISCSISYSCLTDVLLNWASNSYKGCTETSSKQLRSLKLNEASKQLRGLHWIMLQIVERFVLNCC